MLGQPFAHDIIRKYVIAFGTLFNNIKLQRSDNTGVQQWISVPVSFSSKEKWVNRLTDPNLSQQIALTLPRIGYDLVTLTYDPDRKLNTINRHVSFPASSNTGFLQTVYESVPYNFQFALYLYSRNAADATNIIEQILPFFTPEFTLTINDMTPLNIDVDIPIRIDGISKEDLFEGAFENARTLIWTIDFTLKGQLFGPTQNAKLIKKAYVDFFVPDTLSSNLHSVPTASRIYTQPGLMANGYPTTNSSLSVAVSQIDADDDYGIIQTKTFFPDHPTLAGTRRNLVTGIDEDIIGD